MSNEKKYLYYLFSINNMPKITIVKLDVRSKLDGMIAYKIGEVIKKISINSLNELRRTHRDGDSPEMIEAFTLDRNRVEKLYDEINSYNMEKRREEIKSLNRLLVEFEENKNPNRKITIYGDN